MARFSMVVVVSTTIISVVNHLRDTYVTRIVQTPYEIRDSTIMIESVKTTSMENVSTGVLDKNKKHRKSTPEKVST